MDVQRLRVLTEVARTGSYTAAAQALGYTQPAVSYQMRRLQQAVGAPLVVRVGRGLRLTEVGQTLVKQADAIFSALRAADQEVASAVAHGGGLVRMTAFQSSCMTLVPRAVQQLAATCPDVRVTVAQAEPVEARRLVRSGEADLGLLCDWENEELPEGEETMLRLELMTDRRVVVMREDHPLAGRSSVDLAELADNDWVMESFRDRFLAACTHLGFAPKVVATVDDSLATQALVASGLGISLVNELGLHAHLSPGLVCRPLSNWPLRRTYLLLWPDMLEVAAVAAVVRAVRATADQAMTTVAAPRRAAGHPLPAGG